MFLIQMITYQQMQSQTNMNTHLNFSFSRTEEGKSVTCDVKELSKDQITFIYLYYLIDFVKHETLEDLFLKFRDVNVFNFIL